MSFMPSIAAAIGHQRRRRPDRGREQQAGHVRRRADAAVRLLHRAAVGFEVGDELAQVLGRKILACATITAGECAVGPIGAKSRESYLMFGRQHREPPRAIPCFPPAACSRPAPPPRPAPLPTVPPAPPTFSITSDWPSVFDMCSVTMRAITSLGPPAGKRHHHRDQTGDG